MPELSVEAISVAVRWHTDYLPLSDFPDDLLPKTRLTAETGGVPREHLLVVNPHDTDVVDVSMLALAALGAPDQAQPLFLVRSGPLRDPMVTTLARLVLESGWAGEDVGITHLDEVGGTVIFDLLDWAVPVGGVTALVCDEPLFGDARIGMGRFAAVGLRMCRGPGPLRVLECGEGAPTGTPAGVREFAGAGPCDAWLALHTAATEGRLADGDELLLRAVGGQRQGWLRARALDVAALRLTEASEPLEQPEQPEPADSGPVPAGSVVR